MALNATYVNQNLNPFLLIAQCGNLLSNGLGATLSSGSCNYACAGSSSTTCGGFYTASRASPDRCRADLSVCDLFLGRMLLRLFNLANLDRFQYNGDQRAHYRLLCQPVSSGRFPIRRHGVCRAGEHEPIDCSSR
jgi:hypothetical protein